ncbi:hypothetical protein OESDEN_22165 [Oesophagostomum dentatum]|uniref:Uncharacterized protein n=1 Tax=Oesophagostomum dentatum TaxID=61180 RepID=A0A0B1S4T9_OESDE|nr:hypothetical protein OESDEN_22165 [Oesophagostomum dentatum]
MFSNRHNDWCIFYASNHFNGEPYWIDVFFVGRNEILPGYLFDTKTV